jgi:hypothetical protein
MIKRIARWILKEEIESADKKTEAEINKAILTFPTALLATGTTVTVFCNTVMVANPKCAPMIYRKGLWATLGMYMHKAGETPTITGWNK